ncbi:hypothetical protein Ct61P_08547 [Colletotrichum tofieldiae]|nr:hypothetical protein Ct61P_08547 [Colletotrichum tofieldiae]
MASRNKSSQDRPKEHTHPLFLFSIRHVKHGHSLRISPTSTSASTKIEISRSAHKLCKKKSDNEEFGQKNSSVTFNLAYVGAQFSS